MTSLTPIDQAHVFDYAYYQLQIQVYSPCEVYLQQCMVSGFKKPLMMLYTRLLQGIVGYFISVSIKLQMHELGKLIVYQTYQLSVRTKQNILYLRMKKQLYLSMIPYSSIKLILACSKEDLTVVIYMIHAMRQNLPEAL